MLFKFDFKLFVLCYFLLIFDFKLSEENRIYSKNRNKTNVLRNGKNFENIRVIPLKLVNVTYIKENKFNGSAEEEREVVGKDSQKARPVNECQCGKVKKRRIVNGTPAPIEDYPWTVQIVFSNNDEQFCGGSIINEKYVLTAAHCTDGLTSEEVYIRYAYTGPDTIGRKMNIEKFIVHELYTKDKIMYFDIALLRMQGEFIYDSKVQPVCLGRNREITNEEGVILGWGTIYIFGPKSENLLMATVNITNHRDCRKVSEYKVQELHANVLCGIAPNKDACHNDSGGPFVWFNDMVASYFLVGIVSWGTGCADSRYPGVYTNVAAYWKWILSKTGDAIYCTPQ
ncbi:UNVERIFIED_CONTAM: hypothetical protein RMT77_000596 [Armadillidium vulgare]